MIGGVTRRGSSSVFVGRRAELERLMGAFTRAGGGEPSVVLVAGEAGVGKSRLVTEIASAVELGGGWAATGGCLDLGEGGLPYAPFVEAFRALARRVEPGARPAAFGPHMETLARIVPDLRPIDAVDGADTDGGPDPSAGLAALFDAVLDVLGRLAMERPLMVILEDIHWADGSTRDLIRFLVRNLRTERLAIVATYRSDDVHRRHPVMPLLAELDRADRVDRVDLGRFGRHELVQQLAAILGEDPTPTLTEIVHARSDGIPFYVEELIAEGGSGGMSSTLHDILELRLASLSPRALELVRAAAVIGGRFLHDRLVAVAVLDEDHLVDALRESIEAGILVTVDDVGGPSYAFRHALLREAAYDDLLPAERVRIHARLADHFEQLLESDASNDRSVVADLALHAYRAHDQPRALVAAVRAMEALMVAFAFREALVHAERALELWPRVAGAEAAAGVRHADLLILAARIAANASETVRALGLAQAAAGELDAEAEPERLASTLEELWILAWEADEFAVAREASARALDIVRDWPPSRLKAQILVAVGGDQWTSGRMREAVRSYEDSMAISRAIGDERAWAMAASPLAHTLADLGRPGRAADLVDEVQATQMPFDSSIWPYWVVVDQAQALWFAGRFEDAMQAERIALEAADRYGVMDRTGPWLYPMDGLFELGRYEEVEALIERSAGAAIAGHPMLNDIGVAIKLHVVRGRFAEAHSAIATLPDAVGNTSMAWRLEGHLLLARAEGRFDDVHAAVEELRTLSGSGEMDGVMWFILGTGIGAAADEAVRARRRRQMEDASAAGDRRRWRGSDHLRRMAAEAAADGGAGAFLEAILATAEADGSAGSRTFRLARPGRASSKAGRRWTIRSGRPLQVYASARRSSTLEGTVEVAAPVLRDAHRTATAIGAVPLRQEIESVAARGSYRPVGIARIRRP